MYPSLFTIVRIEKHTDYKCFKFIYCNRYFKWTAINIIITIQLLQLTNSI